MTLGRPQETWQRIDRDQSSHHLLLVLFIAIIPIGWSPPVRSASRHDPSRQFYWAVMHIPAPGPCHHTALIDAPMGKSAASHGRSSASSQRREFIAILTR